MDGKKFPTPPKLPPHVRPRICRFGMSCTNQRCTYIHVRPRSGRTISALGIGDEVVDNFKGLLKYDKNNIFELDDENIVSNLGGVIEEESDGEDVDPIGLGLGCVECAPQPERDEHHRRWARTPEGRASEAAMRADANELFRELGPKLPPPSFTFGGTYAEAVKKPVSFGLGFPGPAP